jgi:hypothetical protein
VTDDIRSLVLRRSPSHEIRNAAVKHGMRSLREDGWRIVREGRTTIEEVMWNTKDEEAGASGFGNAAVHAGDAPGEEVG